MFESRSSPHIKNLGASNSNPPHTTHHHTYQPWHPSTARHSILEYKDINVNHDILGRQKSMIGFCNLNFLSWAVAEAFVERQMRLVIWWAVTGDAAEFVIFIFIPRLPAHLLPHSPSCCHSSFFPTKASEVALEAEALIIGESRLGELRPEVLTDLIILFFTRFCLLIPCYFSFSFSSRFSPTNNGPRHVVAGVESWGKRWE